MGKLSEPILHLIYIGNAFMGLFVGHEWLGVSAISFVVMLIHSAIKSFMYQSDQTTIFIPPYFSVVAMFISLFMFFSKSDFELIVMVWNISLLLNYVLFVILSLIEKTKKE